MDQEPTLKDILNAIHKNREVIDFLKENMASNHDVADIRHDIVKLRRELLQLRDDMISHVDGFVGNYKKQESESAAIVSRQLRLEEKLERVIKHLNLDLA